MIKKTPFDIESMTIEDDKVWLWFGRPHLNGSSKIDVTMAFNLGKAVALGQWDQMQFLNLKS